MAFKDISDHSSSKSSAKRTDRYLLGAVGILLFIYLGIFTYLNLFQYTRHVDSDIAVEALLAREIWEEKDLTPDTWISSTERRVVGTSAVASLFYGISGSMVFSTGISCVIVGGILLLSIAFTLKRCNISRLGIATALLALCALPINGLRNDGQMVPFVMLLWFLFADYYAMHCICLFLCIAFYIYLRELGLKGGALKQETASKRPASPARFSSRRGKLTVAFLWMMLTGFCGALALGGMRCLQVVVLPLVILEALLLFFESDHMTSALPRRRWLATGFILSLLAAGILAKLHPTSVEYPLYLQNADGMVGRLIRDVPVAVLECLGIAGGCKVGSFASIMQLGILAVIALILYGLFYLFGKVKTSKNQSVDNMSFSQKTLLQTLGASFLFTVFVEIVTNAETAHNYFFVIWFLIMTVLAVLITVFQKTAPRFARLITLCVCFFALCNLFYTYKDCVRPQHNLEEYEEVIAYMDSEGIRHGYAEFWDASRICVMTDGRITMGHCYHMEDLRMYWWLTSTKWYVPNLPEQMPTAYVVCREDKAAFEAQFEDDAAPPVMICGFENDRFAVYISDQNLVPML